MSIPKHLNKHAVLLAMETTSYLSGTPALAPATDGFKVYETPDPDYSYLDDGMREGMEPGGSGGLQRLAASGRKFGVDLVHYFKGAGAAYATNTRSSVDRVLRALGMSATVGGGVGTEKIDYAFLSDLSLNALVAEIYSRGQKHNGKGCYVSKIVIDAQGLVVPKWTITLNGVSSALPGDSSVPVVAYALESVKNPKAVGTLLTIVSGGQTFAAAKMRHHTLTLERVITDRGDQVDVVLQHAGFMLGEWKATLEAELEITALVPGAPYLSSSAIDPYRLFENASLCALTWQHGSVQYNRVKYSGPTAQLVERPTEDKDGPIPLWNTKWELKPSTETADDGLLITTD